MAFCSKCGAKLAAGAEFCASCGTATGGSVPKGGTASGNSTAGAKEKLNAGGKKLNAGINKLPFTKLAGDKIPAGARAKVPLLEKAIPFANQIVCGLAVVLVVVIIIAASSGGGPKGLAKQAYTLSQKALKAGLDLDSSASLARKSLVIQQKVLKLSAEGQLLYAEELARLMAGGGSGKSSGGSSGGGSKKLPTKKLTEAADFIYELNQAGDGVVITALRGAQVRANVIIPAQIEGVPVVAFIPSRSLAGMPTLLSVVFPDSITEIGGEYLFKKCGWLESITLPKNLKEIPARFAEECTSLTTVKWPENLEIIGGQAFWHTGFTTLVIPEGVKEIRDNAFYFNRSLVSLTIPDSVEYIGKGAFHDNSALTTVKIPSKTIKYQTYDAWNSWRDMWDSDRGAFEGCTRLGIAQQKAIKDTGYKGKFTQ